MPTRILREGIIDSERVDKLSYQAEILYRRLMSVADDFGRYEADAVMLRSKCFPRRTDRIDLAEVEAWLSETVEAELVVVYTVGRKRFLQILDFGQRIRSKSKYPDPPAAMIGQLTAGVSNPPTNDRACRPTRAQGRSESESEAYSESKAETESEAPRAAAPRSIEPAALVTPGDLHLQKSANGAQPIANPDPTVDPCTRFKAIWRGGAWLEDTWRAFVMHVNTPERLAAFERNAPLWMKTRKYAEGFGWDSVKFLKSGVWLDPPGPELMPEHARAPAESPPQRAGGRFSRRAAELIAEGRYEPDDEDTGVRNKTA